MNDQQPTPACRQCGRKVDASKHYGYCLSCIRTLANRHRCQSCPGQTFNASRYCVWCIKAAEAGAEGKVAA